MSESRARTDGTICSQVAHRAVTAADERRTTGLTTTDLQTDNRKSPDGRQKVPRRTTERSPETDDKRAARLTAEISPVCRLNIYRLALCSAITLARSCCSRWTVGRTNRGPLRGLVGRFVTHLSRWLVCSRRHARPLPAVAAAAATATTTTAAGQYSAGPVAASSRRAVP